MTFAYSRSWLERPRPEALHPWIPLANDRIASSWVTAFFENLLPEGDQRKLIAMREQVSSVYGLLCKVGGESAGSVMLLPEGQQSRVTWRLRYRNIYLRRQAKCCRCWRQGSACWSSAS